MSIDNMQKKMVITDFYYIVVLKISEFFWGSQLMGSFKLDFSEKISCTEVYLGTW